MAGACTMSLGVAVLVAMQLTSIAVAAEVDAVGAAAPVGFADIIERVRPAVVGVRVKTEERGSWGDDIQQESPFPPGSPFDRFFRQFEIPLPGAGARSSMNWPRKGS